MDNKVLLKNACSKADQFGGAMDRKRTPLIGRSGCL